MLELLYSLFIDPFIMLPFLKRALVASMMIAVSSGLVGVFLLLNRMSLVGDALSHGVLPGIAIAFLFFGFNIYAMSFGGVIAGVSIAIVASLISHYTNLKEDASFAALYLFSLAIGVVLIMEMGSQADLLHILFGSVLAVDESSLYLVWSVLVMTLMILSLIYRPLLLYIVDPLYLALKTKAGLFFYGLFLFLVVLNLVASFQVLGTLMTVGMMMIPAICARLWSNRMERVLLIAIILGVLGAYLGLVASVHYDIASGPMIILVLASFYVVSLFFGFEGGIFRRKSGKIHRKA
ncbi:metal ABC transporter permease [Ignatzschineria rhizosphaerae]|uniref:Metal ABC transporter permease n=1 Tax=Ignatzschineria rhizosphaerae TaxID=2923279 RepID=A0ABY3WZP9_9GAMM|nr:metal ABC transporter permease [Ignatzschineria rhizosphaerae]UNM96101.1 metal ABC transporter permease [Ignatzschineria rhizosphaerae]